MQCEFYDWYVRDEDAVCKSDATHLLVRESAVYAPDSETTYVDLHVCKAHVATASFEAVDGRDWDRCPTVTIKQFVG